MGLTAVQQAPRDVDYAVYDDNDELVKSGIIKGNGNSACNWQDTANCNPGGNRDSELKVVFRRANINWSWSPPKTRPARRRSCCAATVVRVLQEGAYDRKQLIGDVQRIIAAHEADKVS